jgi:hypothetical protein
MATASPLTGSLGQSSVYFYNQKRLRHQLYTLNLEQKTVITPRLNGIVKGRFSYDAALESSMPTAPGPQKDLPKEVRRDEMLEGSARAIYLDYLGDSSRVQAGLITFDWIDALSPLISGIITPLDLRRGGFGDQEDLILPVPAVAMNHGFFGGALDWVVVLGPKTHRLPRGENGYGIFSQIYGAPDNPAPFAEDIPSHVKESEFGLRYLASLDSLELTLLAYHGHERFPVARLTPVSATAYTAKMTYPRVNTYGFTAAYSKEAWVSRFMTYYQPHKVPILTIDPAPTLPPAPADDEDAKDPYEKSLRLGLGFDFVFSKHLKLYSEHFITRRQSIKTESKVVDASDTDGKDTHDSQLTSLRLTNETFNKLLLSIDVTVVGPRSAQLYSPKIVYSMSDNTSVELGGRVINSQSRRSEFEPLKKSTQIYLNLTRFFDADIIEERVLSEPEPEVKRQERPKPARKKSKRRKKT